jgi:osmotically-inducible protein OsmY
MRGMATNGARDLAGREVPARDRVYSVTEAAERIAKLAERRLQESGYCCLRRVSCHYHEGVLALRGRVPSFYLKQVAQTVVRQIEGVIEILNQVEVVDSSAQSVEESSK